MTEGPRVESSSTLATLRALMARGTALLEIHGTHCEGGANLSWRRFDGSWSRRRVREGIRAFDP